MANSTKLYGQFPLNTYEPEYTILSELIYEETRIDPDQYEAVYEEELATQLESLRQEHEWELQRWREDRRRDDPFPTIQLAYFIFVVIYAWGQFS